MNGVTQKDLANPIKINEIRLEHFENFKKLRRKMDHAYLKVRGLQGTTHGAVQADTSRSSYSAAAVAKNSSRGLLPGASTSRSNNANVNGPAPKITNPVYTENLRAYNQLSQTLSSLHA